MFKTTLPVKIVVTKSTIVTTCPEYFMLWNEKVCIILKYLVHSQLLYGILLWGKSTGAQTVFKWQRKALRILKGLPDTVSCRPPFKEMQIMTVSSLYILCI